MKKYINFLGIAFLLISGAAISDSTSLVPPSPSSMTSSGGSVPKPPVCNTSTQKLHWNGSAWQCLAVGHATSANSATTAGSVSGYAKGSVASAGMTTATPTCPSGFKPLVVHTENSGFNIQNKSYICIK